MNLEHVQQLIVDGQLLTSEQCDERRRQWLAGAGASNDGAAFVSWLVEQGDLSEFQGRAVQAGIPGPYMLGPYRVTARQTAGRLGDVFLAEHVEFRQPVSLKVFPAALQRDPERLARLGREARVALQLEEHPNVVKTYQVGRVGEVSFIAFEALRGESLERRLARDGCLPFGEACQLIQQAALGLAYLHGQDIVHRDICPANLWVGAEGRLKIMEFSAAHDAMSFIDSLDEEQPASKDDYDRLSAEQIRDRMRAAIRAARFYDYRSVAQVMDPNTTDAACDLYSLGCTFYRCLAGRVPFSDRNPVRQMLRHAFEEPQPLGDFDPEIPHSVQEVVSYLLAKNPDERYGTAQEVADALAIIMPLAIMPAPTVVAPDFRQWIQTMDSDSVGIVKEVTAEPELQEFVDWLWQADEKEAN